MIDEFLGKVWIKLHVFDFFSYHLNFEPFQLETGFIMY